MLGQVVLIGAGCGRGLISLNGLAALKQAEVLIYDDLIDHSLLTQVGDSCHKIYVGKRHGQHSYSQDQINQLLIEQASLGKQVVRLKGGDSFVFGRGGEEYLALQKQGIDCSLIPGISSAIAVPERFGIPVTHRGIAQSFTVVTGHTATDITEDYAALAQLNGTLVFLMGIHSIEQIAAALIRHGKDPMTPAAVLCRGFSGRDKRIDGRLETIANEAKRQQAETPGILVIGEVAAFEMTGPQGELSHRRIAVCGTNSFIGRLSKKLEALGAYVEQRETLGVMADTTQIPEELSDYDWLVFTSGNGIDLFFEDIRKRGLDIRSLAHLKFACIGSGTAQRLLKHQIQADFVPKHYTAYDFGSELAGRVRPGEKLLILRAKKGSKQLTEALEKAQIAYDDRKIYDTQWLEFDSQPERLDDCHYIVFASAEGVKAFLAKQAIPENAEIICIGHQTAEVLEQDSGRAYHVALEHSADGIVELICQLEQPGETK